MSRSCSKTQKIKDLFQITKSKETNHERLQKAQSLIFNRKIRLKTISQITGIAYPTIRSYVAHPDKMKTAAWERINALALLYDKLNADQENNQ